MKSKTVERLLNSTPQHIKDYADAWTLRKDDEYGVIWQAADGNEFVFGMAEYLQELPCSIPSKELKPMYLVQYSTGIDENHVAHIVFVTDNKSKATKYVIKFNSMLKRWSKHYSQFEEKLMNTMWIKSEFEDKHYKRWVSLRNTNRCHWFRVDFR